jgi:tetratricopeptide (TPR) repeat protein
VFQNIHSNRLTGTIKVSTRDGDRYVYFKEGLIAGYSRGVNKGLPLGDHLAQRRYVSRDLVATAIKKKGKTQKLLREVLAEMNLLSEDEFQGALIELIEESLFDLLLLKEASFTFTEGEPLARVFDMEQKAAHVALDPSAILMESARRHDEWDRIHRVVLSDRDLFVILEGWEECELDEPAVEVGNHLDGRTDIEGVLSQLPYSRFDVLKAISDLVMQGHARPLSVGEIETMAEEALANEDPEEAVTLLTHALMTERSNKELRLRLIELFEQLDRKGEAASELALLGYQQAQLGRVNEALKLYAHAAELNPSDLMLHERRVDLLRDEERHREHAEATLQLVDLLLTMGLADRARASLQKALKVPALNEDRQLSERLAEVEASLGHGDVAGEIYLSLAGQLPKKDDQGRLVYLKKAFTYRPGDTTLGQLIQDMVTGQHTLRRARRRRRVALGAGGVTLFDVGTAGVVEIVTAHRVMQVLEGNLGDITAGRPSAAVHELDAVWARYGWTVSGRHAGRLAEQLLTAEIRHLEGLLRTGDYAAVLERLEWLERQVSRADIRQRLGALVERTRLEQQASALFLKVNGQPKPDATALKALSELTEPGHLDFILGRLSDPGTKPHATQALLASLQKIDSPRSFLVVARLYQKSTDARVDELAKAILMRARHHRLQGREDSWSGIYPELEAAQGARAKQILQWLRGD